MNKSDSKWYDKKYEKEFNELTSWNSKILELICNYIKKNDIQLVDLGCGKGVLIKEINSKLKVKKSNLFGVDQSKVTVNKLNKEGFRNVSRSYVEKLPFSDEQFDIVILAEVIEHLRNRDKSILEIKRILKKKGLLIISFPNYLNFPWLILRLFSELFDKPNWINLQPYDKIYTYFFIRKLFKKNEFKFIKSKGTCYFPPLIYKYEPLVVSNLLSKMGLSFLSLHPVLIFIKG